MHYDQADLIEMLKSGEHTVVFTKADGELRTITGSLPSDAGPKNDTACPIVDSSTGLWKSFLIANLVSINPEACEEENDGQPSEYDEWQDYYDGDDWDHGQYDDPMF